MDVLFRSAGLLVMWIVGVSLFLLVNGGYVYKTSCPLAGGGTQTHWTYGIDDILPYIRQTDAPCKSHTGTRLLASAVGIAPLDKGQDRVVLDVTKVTPGDQRGADSLRSATEAINAEYERERTAVSRLKGQGSTAYGRQITRFMVSALTESRRIKRQLDRPVNASDPLLVNGRQLLSRWLSLQIETDLSLLSATSKADAQEAEASAYAKLKPVATELRSLSSSISAKYPEVSAWEFLFNTE